MDGPGLHYVRRSYRKQADSILKGNLHMLTRQTPEAAQVHPACLPFKTSDLNYITVTHFYYCRCQN